MDGSIAFMVPTILFLCIVAPVWIFMHYRSKQNAQGALSEVERTELESLTTQAQRMMDRVETLESILDDDTPGWRKRMSVE